MLVLNQVQDDVAQHDVVQHDVVQGDVQQYRHAALDAASLEQFGFVMKESYVYILSNKNRTVLYIGVTADLLKRITQHKNKEGSIFTKKYSVSDLMYFETFTDINDAIKREKQLKNWHKDWKWQLIKEQNPDLKDLFPSFRA